MATKKPKKPAPKPAVDLEISAPKTELKKGEKTVARLRITGLKNVRRPLILEIQNLTPKVVKLPDAPPTIEIDPHEVGPNGVFETEILILAIDSGPFTISVSEPAWVLDAHLLDGSKKPWKDAGHSCDKTRRWQRDGHALNDTKTWDQSPVHDYAKSKEWRGDGHSYTDTKAWNTDRHDYTLTKQWRGENHQFATTRAWGRDGHEIAKSFNWKGHEFNESRQWERDNHTLTNTKSWRGDNHAEQATKQQKDDDHVYDTSKEWKGDNHAYATSKEWKNRKPKRHEYDASKFEKGQQ